MSKIDDLLAEEGAAAENHEIPEEMPADVKVSRPHAGRGMVVSVRLSPEEHEQLQRAAEDASLPVSTLIRLWALDRVRAEREGGGGTVVDGSHGWSARCFSARTDVACPQMKERLT